MRPEETVDFYIKSSWHSISKMYNLIASKYGVTQSVGYVLLIIDEKEGIHATKIGPIMGMEATGMSRVLKSMENDGLIVRKKENLDLRIVKICLTPLGIEKRKIASEVVKAFNHSILNEINEEEFSIFKSVIGKIQKVVETQKSMTIV